MKRMAGAASLLAALLMIAGCGSSGSSVTPGSPAVYFSTAVMKGYSTGFTTYSSIRGGGYNGFGQLGDGTTTSRSTFSRIPLPVPQVSGIAVGGYHTLIFSTYSAWSAGGNESGQLGRVLTSGKNQDERFGLVTPLTTSDSGNRILALSAGAAHSVALLSNGEVRCWGVNDRGQLGNGGGVKSTTPVSVLDDATKSSLSAIVEISAGAAHTLARTGSGQVYAWGYNAYGQLGEGGYLNRNAARQLLSFGNLTTARTIAAGGSFSAVVDQKDRLYLFGNNGSGQCGVPFSGSGGVLALPVPRLVDGVEGVKKVSLGTAHILVLTKDGTLSAWGYNAFGQLGNGTKGDSSSPVQVMTGVSDIVAFGNSSFALKGGVWYGWGDNARGQLGVDTAPLTYASTPVPVPGL